MRSIRRRRSCPREVLPVIRCGLQSGAKRVTRMSQRNSRCARIIPSGKGAWPARDATIRTAAAVIFCKAQASSVFPATNAYVVRWSSNMRLWLKTVPTVTPRTGRRTAPCSVPRSLLSVCSATRSRPANMASGVRLNQRRWPVRGPSPVPSLAGAPIVTAPSTVVRRTRSCAIDS